jgi:hypothetical protein
VKKIHSTTGTPESTSPTEPPKYQYQRAYALSKDLRDQLYTFSAEQINQIKNQNALVKRATEAAQQVSAVASSSYGAAQEKVHSVSDVMLQELQKVQVRTRSRFHAQFIHVPVLQQSTASLPAQLQSSFNDISAHLTITISDISGILTSDDPLNEKVTKVRDHVQERVYPLLEATQARAQEILDSIRGKASETNDHTTSNDTANDLANGNGHA